MLTTTLVTKEEYFEELLKSDVKLEYHAGEIIAMAGAQPAHNRICITLAYVLENCLHLGKCIVLSSDQLVKIETCERYTFPDLVIVCEDPIYEKSPNGLDALENPEIIIEVSSDSTELYDRSEKRNAARFECYQTLQSLKEYVLVASKKKQVEVFRRYNENEWILHIYSEKDNLVKIGTCEVLLDDIYNKVSL
jgi:Uma2 family endonuclease